MNEGTCNTCCAGCKGKRCTIATVAWALVIIGALNWGLVGIGGFAGINLNVVDLILGKIAWLENVVYILVALGAVSSLIGCKCKTCKSCCDTHEGASTSTGGQAM